MAVHKVRTLRSTLKVSCSNSSLSLLPISFVNNRHEPFRSSATKGPVQTELVLHIQLSDRLSNVAADICRLLLVRCPLYAVQMMHM